MSDKVEMPKEVFVYDVNVFRTFREWEHKEEPDTIRYVRADLVDKS